jgi:septum formation protein
MKIILSSTSPYRIEQLKNLGLKFIARAPRIDEEALKASASRLSPRRLAAFLAYKKAASLVSDEHAASDTVIIGADQLVSFKNLKLGKPGNFKNAVRQLMAMRGAEHELITSVCAIGYGKVFRHTDIARIKMRRYSLREIEAYVRRDKPYDCAGAYRFEKGGLGLVEWMKVQDPSSLIGLPLIAVVNLLSQFKKPIGYTR